MDAMFQPRPHGAIAVDPLTISPYDFPSHVNRLFRGRYRATCKLARRKATHGWGCGPRWPSNKSRAQGNDDVARQRR